MSELAAKPISQTNKYVLNYIEQISSDYCVLDYGCGKLRYSIHLAQRAKQVIAIDSEEQVNKKQKIGEYYGAAINFEFPNLVVSSVNSSSWKEKKYDLVFCTNVLSAIPFEKERFEILKNSKSVMKNTGKMFISNQYRNSYYSKYKYRLDAEPYNDGWLLKKRNSNRCSFYAILSDDYVIELCKQAGFTAFSKKKKDGSYFIEARAL